MKRVLIIDDVAAWFEQARRLLEPAGYQVEEHLVTEPHELIVEALPQQLHEKLQRADILLTDKDIGAGLTTDCLLCLVRAKFPLTPVIRWTGGYEDRPTTRFLRVTTIGKPTRGKEGEFLTEFERAVEEQRLILAGPMAVFRTVEDRVEEDERKVEMRQKRLRQLKEIAQLTEEDPVPMLDEGGEPMRDFQGYRMYWTLQARDGIAGTMHEIGHAICDGHLDADDIRPFLEDLQKVVRKLEAAGDIDDRFRTCADFILKGDLGELELVHRCY
jgi:hypothetical protein